MEQKPDRFESFRKTFNEKIKSVEDEQSNIDKTLDEIHQEVHEVEKRIIALQLVSDKNEGRWNKIMNFVIQLIWVALAAYLLYTLKLEHVSLP